MRENYYNLSHGQPYIASTPSQYWAAKSVDGLTNAPIGALTNLPFIATTVVLGKVLKSALKKSQELQDKVSELENEKEKKKGAGRLVRPDAISTTNANKSGIWATPANENTRRRNQVSPGSTEPIDSVSFDNTIFQSPSNLNSTPTVSYLDNFGGS